MKKIIFAGILCVWSAAGCVSWQRDARTREARTPAAQGVPMSAQLPSGPISADVVEPANAHRVAEAIWDEMDRDQRKDAAAKSGDAKKR
jgi:hypothetical protein